jgi:flagellin-like hook-associated protein FlgL
LSSRASDLNGLMDDINTAFKVLDATSTGITAMTTSVNNAINIATSALNSAGTTARKAGTVSGLTAATSFVTTNATTITFNDGVTTGTLTLGAATTVQQFLDAVNNTANLNVKASLNSSGQILLEATSTNVITIGGTASVGDKAQFGFANGTTVAGTLNTTRSTYATQYNGLLTQITQLAGDASLNGINLLNGGTLKVNLNEKGTAAYTVAGVTFDAPGLGLANATNTWQTDKDINDAITKLNTALTTLKTQSTTFATNSGIIQVRKDFTNSLVSSLQAASDSLTLADSNQEGANLLALQTRQQLAGTTLSMATQSDQTVLRMFGR